MHMVLKSLCAVVVAASAMTAVPATAQTPTRAAIDATCKPGADPQAAGDESYAGGLSLAEAG